MDSRTMITIRGRKGGKTGGVAAERLHKDPVMPMSNASRQAGYEKQNGSKQLTGPQLKRLARHDLKCACEDDLTYAPGTAPWARRFGRMRPIRQHFRPTIDNQRKPTGRVGIARFGPQQGIEGLNKLLFAPRKSEKGMDLDSNRLASVAGRLMARTASGRRRMRRYSSRGR